MKSNVKEWSALLLIVAGIALVFVGMLVEPQGQIHESVIYIFAQILIYCGSIFGIDMYIKKSIKEHINKKEDEEHSIESTL